MAFHGVNVAAITPRGKAGGEVDLGAALDLIDFLCAAGVGGIELLGAAGEFHSLDSDSRSRLTYMAVKRSRVPLLVGVSHSSLDACVDLGREAGYAGAGGLLLMPPLFYRYGQAEILEYYARFAAQMPRGVPLFLDHAPSLTSPIEIATAVELLGSGQFAGIKDSSGDPAYLEGLRDTAGTLLVDDNTKHPRAHGTVSAAACAAPELMVALHRARAEGNQPVAERLQARLGELLAWLSRFPVPMGVKEAVAVRGVKVGPPAVPPACETQRALGEFRAWFGTWITQVKKEAA